MHRSNFDDVGKFHERFGLPNVTYGDVGPVGINFETYTFRSRFMQEELNEWREAVEEGDDAKAFDALIDLVYVALGTAHLQGFPWQEGWDLVQAANMAKKRATRPEQSERGGTLDVIKPEGWTPPDIEGLLKTHRWSVAPYAGTGGEQ